MLRCKSICRTELKHIMFLTVFLVHNQRRRQEASRGRRMLGSHSYEDHDAGTCEHRFVPDLCS